MAHRRTAVTSGDGRGMRPTLLTAPSAAASTGQTPRKADIGRFGDNSGIGRVPDGAQPPNGVMVWTMKKPAEQPPPAASLQTNPGRTAPVNRGCASFSATDSACACHEPGRRYRKRACDDVPPLGRTRRMWSFAGLLGSGVENLALLVLALPSAIAQTCLLTASASQPRHPCAT